LLTKAKQTLPRAERVLRRPDFERAYNTGAKMHGRFMTVFAVANGGTAPRLGIAATRKMGDAVERNRAKRLARELFRRHKPDAGLDVIIVPRREMVDALFATLEADYLATLARARTDRRDRPSRGRPSAPRPRGSRGGGAPRV
jgi:ribonuclease P protein component